MLTDNEKKIITLITLERQDPAFNEHIGSSDEVAREEIAAYKAAFEQRLPMIERAQAQGYQQLNVEAEKLAEMKLLLGIENTEGQV